MAPFKVLVILALLALQGIWAHLGHNVTEEAVERAQFLKRNPRSVRSCASQLQRRGHWADASERRQGLALRARAKRDLSSKPLLRRDFAAYNSTHASAKDVSYGDEETLLFSDNSTCLLQPEVTQGPDYVDGELIRSNLTEDQVGVPLYLDIQVIDTSTCEPMPAIFADLWHCNATGVYSGVSATGNGNSANDTSNLDATFLRGVQQTDLNGVVQFSTIFPGHYTGRATHIHVMTHNTNSTIVRTNSTILSSNASTTHASHVGQIFFDQSLISLVEASEPYASNTQDVTLNADDSILGEEAASMDPFAEYILLNAENVSDGVLVWVSIGIDPTADDEISSAATHYESEGVANENSEGMGGGGPGNTSGGGGNGTIPSGRGSGAALPSSTSTT